MLDSVVSLLSVSDGAHPRGGEQAGTGGSTAEGAGNGPVIDEQNTDTLGGRETTDESISISAVALLDTLPQPAFILAEDGHVLGWNDELAELTDVAAEEVLGKKASGGLYRGDREETLADIVTDSPDSADERPDVERVGRDQRAYEREETLTNQDDETIHVESTAAPVVQNGEFVGVVQTLKDVTEEIRKQEVMADLVMDAVDVGERVADGDLDARVEYTDDTELLGEDLRELTDVINDVAATTQELLDGVATEVDELASSTDKIALSAVEVNDRVDEQNSAIASIVHDLEDLSATMEEVAASSDQVAAAAEEARSAAENGLEANRSAAETVGEVQLVTDDLEETVDELNERMEAIDEVVEVVADVAEQTNLLALNANIEAARADTDGSGFEVVADEVKALADETKSHTVEISDGIAAIKEQTAETVESTQTTTERVEEADSEITSAVESLESIVDAVQEAAEGIDEIASANEDQAMSIEQSSATASDVLTDANEIADQISEIAAEVESQCDDIDDILSHLETVDKSGDVTQEMEGVSAIETE